jgi:hypothetical protein
MTILSPLIIYDKMYPIFRVMGSRNHRFRDEKRHPNVVKGYLTTVIPTAGDKKYFIGDSQPTDQLVKRVFC